MTRLIKRTLVLALALGMAGLVGWVKGFSLAGPFESWQVPALGYNVGGAEVSAPKQVNEGYRWNLQTITYGFDKSFIDYFGEEGISAVEGAIQMLQDLPAFSDIPDDGSSMYVRGEPVPRDTYFDNGAAASLGLIDIKTTALAAMLRELGLDIPERWVWALENRTTRTVGGVTYTNYLVGQYNFDPITKMRSAYVNNVQFDYQVNEFTTPIAYADAREKLTDGSAFFPASSIAGFGWYSMEIGRVATALTHDDVGGLRWLYHRDRVNVENLLTNAVLGTPILGGGSPWMPYLGATNFITQGTNSQFSTGTNGTNVVVRQALRPGINKLNFQRVNFDSLIGQTFVPITNRFTDTYISNGVFVVQPVQRVITEPDIIFVASRLPLDADGDPWLSAFSDTTGWQNNDAINGLDAETDGGPGVIQPPVRISFSSRLPFYRASPDFFPVQSLVTWGSFDAATPSSNIVVFPKYGGITAQDLRRYVVRGAR